MVTLTLTVSCVQETRSWPLAEPLPSYGRGRELPGARYASFIHGDGLHAVVITGEEAQLCSAASCCMVVELLCCSLSPLWFLVYCVLVMVSIVSSQVSTN